MSGTAKPDGPEKNFLGVGQLTLRSVLIGMVGSVVITASSMYVALKLSALPWPTVFVAVLSMALLKLLGKTSLNEINIAQTGMSAGAMVAGALAFTLPGLWIAGIYQPFDPAKESLASWFLPKFWPVLLIAAAGMVLGSLLCWYLRPRYIEQEQLPYPIGAAAAETLVSGDQGGRKARILFVTLGLTAVFTALRDKIQGFPQALSAVIFKVPVGLAYSPMAIGIGYIIGPVYTGYWLAGAIFANFVIARLGVDWQTFANGAEAGAFTLTAAIGLMVGSGAGILISFIAALFKKKKPADPARGSRPAGAPPAQAGRKRFGLGLLILLSVALSYVFSVLAGLSPAAAALLMLGVLVATAMSATITGQTGINPIEIFGIIILLAVRLFVAVDPTSAFFIAAAVAVACGYAGDLLNDYKAGAVIGTNPNAQLVSQIFGGLIGTVVAAVAIFAVIYQYGGVGGDTGLSAVQAFTVTGMVTGIGDSFVFLVAALIGCVLYLRKIPAMILGIGMLLPIAMSVAIFLGGMIRLVLQLTRKQKSEDTVTGNIVAAGMLGGEGITGVILSLITMFSGR